MSDIVQFISNKPSLIIFVCLAVMLLACYLELKSMKDSFKDYKPIIISIGVFGTFIGIFCGLWNFDTQDITASVPLLLEGLKLAFTTSILGMLFSIILSFIENGQKELPDNDSNKYKKILKDILVEQQKTNKITNSINKSITHSEKNINEQFKTVNESLKKALETLSKGATEEIINTLKKVISDFNTNLTEQFGDNFKQLNEAVKSMITWQENYKLAIAQVEKNLQIAVTNIDSVSEYTQKFASNIEKIANDTEKMTNNYEKISNVSKDLHQIIKVNQNQINTIEIHMKNLQKVGEDAGLITKSINDFSQKIQDSLEGQSKGLSKLSDGLATQLESSLGQLNKALTSLTNKFSDDYKAFLISFKELFPKK